MDFLNAENYFSSTNSQRDYFIDELSNYYYSMKDKVLQRCQNEMESFSEEEANNVNGEEMIHSLLEEELEIETQKHIEAGISPEFEDYTIDNLRSYSHENFDELMELCQEDNFGTDMREQWEHSFYAYVRSQIITREQVSSLWDMVVRISIHRYCLFIFLVHLTIV